MQARNPCSFYALYRLLPLMYAPFYQLRDVVCSFTEGQQKSLWKYLASFGMGPNRKHPKSVQLLKFIGSRPTVSMERAYAICGKDAKGKKVSARAFRSLIQRSLERVLEYLTLTVHYEREDEASGEKAYADVTRTKCRLRNVLTQADFLFLYKREGEAESLWQQAVEDGSEYELFGIAIEACENLAELAVLRHKPELRASYMEQRKRFRKRHRVAFECREQYLDFRELVARSGSAQGAIGVLTESLSELRPSVEAQHSANAELHYRLLEYEYFSAVEQPGAVYKSLCNQLHLVQSHPAVRKPPLLSTIYLLLAENRLSMAMPTDALSDLKKAAAASTESRVHSDTMAELRSLAFIQLNEPEKALRAIQESLRFTDQQDAHSTAKRTYLKSIILYLLGEDKLAYVELQETSELDTDAGGWNLGRRFLSIQLLVERDLLDQAASQITALTKFKEKLVAQNVALRERDLAICKVLNVLNRVGFDFELARAKCRVQFENMQGSDQEWRWQAGTHEVIVFPAWFDAKQHGKPYRFFTPPSLSAFLKSNGEYTEKVLAPSTTKAR